MRMVHFDTPICHEELSGREKKAYRERMRYWTKTKGLKPEDAHKRSLKLPSKKRIRNNEPSKTEISKVIDELTQKGLGSETPVINNSATSFSYKPQVELGRVAELWPIIPHVIIVVAVSFLLISASMEVFGYSAMGLLKSIILEIGILYFAISKTDSSLTFWGKRLSAGVMISLSFFVLHSGSEKMTTTEINTEVAENRRIKLLQDKYDRIRAEYENLPQNYITKRSEIGRSLAETETALTESIDSVKKAASVSAIKKIGLAEIIFRASLVVFNLFLTHEIVKKVSLISQRRAAHV